VYLSEDYALCERAYQAGIPVSLVPSVRLGHIGQYAFMLDDMLQPYRAHAERLRIHKQGYRLSVQAVDADGQPVEAIR
jgi:hypothetical protein